MIRRRPMTLKSIRSRTPGLSREKQVVRLLAENAMSATSTRDMIKGLRILFPAERSLFDRVEAEFESCVQKLFTDSMESSTFRNETS